MESSFKVRSVTRTADGDSFFCPHSKVGVEETAKYTTQHFDLKQTLQVGPRAEAQELIEEDAGRTVANTESFIH